MTINAVIHEAFSIHATPLTNLRPKFLSVCSLKFAQGTFPSKMHTIVTGCFQTGYTAFTDPPSNSAKSDKRARNSLLDGLTVSTPKLRIRTLMAFS